MKETLDIGTRLRFQPEQDFDPIKTNARPSFQTELDFGPIKTNGKVPAGARINEEMLGKILYFDKDGVKFPIKFKSINRGSFGFVYSGTVNGGEFAIKIQKLTAKAVMGLKAAKVLSDCDIAPFRAIKLETETGEAYIATLMPKYTGDCKDIPTLSLSDRKLFFEFMKRLQGCIQEHEIAYTDMKPRNVGYSQTDQGGLIFRLLDLDGTNNDVFSFPLIQRFADGNKKSPEQMKLESEYAFAITTMIVCSNKQDREGIEGKFGVRVLGTYQTKIMELRTYARSDIEEVSISAWVAMGCLDKARDQHWLFVR